MVLPRFRDRPTGDILVLVVAGTVCFSVLASGAIIAVVSVFRPEVEVSHWIVRISGIMNTMVGLLAGFLAGRGGSDSGIIMPPVEPKLTPKPRKRPPTGKDGG